MAESKATKSARIGLEGIVGTVLLGIMVNFLYDVILESFDVPYLLLPLQLVFLTGLSLLGYFILLRLAPSLLTTIQERPFKFPLLNSLPGSMLLAVAAAILGVTVAVLPVFESRQMFSGSRFLYELGFSAYNYELALFGIYLLWVTLFTVRQSNPLAVAIHTATFALTASLALVWWQPENDLYATMLGWFLSTVVGSIIVATMLSSPVANALRRGWRLLIAER